MTTKVNGFTHTPGQFLSGNLVMFTATTAVDIITQATTTTTTDAFGTVTTTTSSHNVALDTLIAAISTRAQPVIMGTPAGTGPYTLNFAVEHTEIFGDLTAFSNEVKAATGDSTVVISAYTF